MFFAPSLKENRRPSGFLDHKKFLLLEEGRSWDGGKLFLAKQEQSLIFKETAPKVGEIVLK